MLSTCCLLPGLWAHCSGALLLPDSGTAIVADVHLGYGWAQRRRGELGPIADERTRKKLFEFLHEIAPKRIVFLGDLVHAPRPCDPERAWVEELLSGLAEKAQLIAVRGNHDRAFAREFAHSPVETVPAWAQDNIVAVHGDKLPSAVEGVLIVGHFHPAIPVRDVAGAGRKLPVFLAGRRCIVLPAFSPFAGGYDLAAGVPTALSPYFDREAPKAYAASKSRVVALGPLSRAIDRMFAADAGAPERFRGRP